MTTSPTGFKRMVVGLPQNLADQAAIVAAADLAEFLQIELLATFVADASLHDLAGFRPVRELRILDQKWQAIDLAQIGREIEDAAGLARRRFAEAVSRRTNKTSFNVIAGAEVLAGLLRADDIVAVIEPTHPGERITRQFSGLLDAALQSAGAVLVVPRRIVRTAGPVMAVANASDDAAIDMALKIAAALKEELVVVTRLGTVLPSALVAEARQLGVVIEQVAASALVADASAHFLSRGRERLRVLTRSLLPKDAPRLFSMLNGVPLLVVTPAHSQVRASNREAHGGT